MGQGENWVDPDERGHGAVLYKQGAVAARSAGDKYNNPPRWNVHPRHGPGVITVGGSVGKTAFRGAIGHVALWNRQLTAAEVAGLSAAGQADLAAG